VCRPGGGTAKASAGKWNRVPAVRGARASLSPIRNPMNNLTLDLEALTVETFATVGSEMVLVGLDQNCTGCDSGCGIDNP
jgi:hypothetical protein